MSANVAMKILLIGSVMGMSALTVAACCNKKTDSDADAAASASAVASAEAAPSASAAVADGPVWKQKCPDAERPESGTVTALKMLQIYKGPDTNSDKLTTINSGTWVDLLGAKGTWYCVDYPCGVGKLCPGWIEERYSQRKIVDAGAADAAIVDASTLDVRLIPLVDAGKTVTPAATNPRLPAGSRPPVTTRPH
jgi:uncharacterized protein YgiM (DUF1202 family)